MGGVRASQRTAISFHKASFLKFVNYFIYVFIWLPQPSTVACGIFCCCAQTLVAAHELRSSLASVIVAYRYSCFTVCGILVPWPRIKPESPALQGGFFTTGQPGKSPAFFFFNRVVIHVPSLEPSLPSEFHAQHRIPTASFICPDQWFWNSAELSESLRQLS